MAASTVVSANRDILGKKAGSKNSRKSALSKRPAQPPIKCPECHSSMIWKDGLRYIRSETGTIAVQRYICRDCGRRFSESISYLQPNRRGYNRTSRHFKRQVCVALAEGSKNLVRVESRIEKRAAGATTKASDIKAKIFEYAWWMKKQGYAESTITRRSRLLKSLVKSGANLLDPESIKEAIAKKDAWSSATKILAVAAYSTFLQAFGGTWNPPQYKEVRKLPFIPLEREIDDLIAGCNRYVATFLQLGKETGARAGELFGLEWIDIDFQRKTVNITAEKGSNPRIFKLSKKLLAMLEGLLKEGELVFSHYRHLKSLRRCFQRYRKRTAHKFGNPRILRITFHTLRHWKATMEYHKTKDILYVQRLLGHKSIKNTLLYTQLVNLEEDEYICAVGKTPETISELIENGFEYVCDQDDLKFFRKRK